MQIEIGDLIVSTTEFLCDASLAEHNKAIPLIRPTSGYIMQFELENVIPRGTGFIYCGWGTRIVEASPVQFVWRLGENEGLAEMSFYALDKCRIISSVLKSQG